MSADPGSLLFVYGTLRRDVGAPAYRLLARHGTLFDRGHVPGRLFDVGRYPALRLGAGPDERVAGEGAGPLSERFQGYREGMTEGH